MADAREGGGDGDRRGSNDNAPAAAAGIVQEYSRNAVVSAVVFVAGLIFLIMGQVRPKPLSSHTDGIFVIVGLLMVYAALLYQFIWLISQGACGDHIGSSAAAATAAGGGGGHQENPQRSEVEMAGRVPQEDEERDDISLLGAGH